MRRVFLFTTLFFIIFILSCGKSNDPQFWSFNWTHKTVSHSATSADAYITQVALGKGPNQIKADISGSSLNYRVSMYLSSLSPNSYPVSLTSNKFDYIDDAGDHLAGVQGTVTISSETDNKLSGSFSVKLINMNYDTTLITGSFINITRHL